MIQKYKIRITLFVFVLSALLITLWTAGYGANFALAQACEPTDIITTCYGDNPSIAPSAGGTAIVRVPAGTTGDARSVETALATYGDVGYTYGLAQDTTTNAWYSSAVVRSGSDLPGLANEPDAIYVLDSTLAAGSNLIHTINLNSFAGVDVGATAGDTYDKADYGTIGIGDIDIDTSTSTLYAMNLNGGGQLVAINVSEPTNATLVSATDVPNPCGVGEGAPRPWATKYDSVTNSVYVGVVCETSINAYVLEYDVTAGSFGASPVVGPHYTGYGSLNQYGPRDMPYLPWDDTFNLTPHPNSTDWYVSPQPILMDIEIYDRGDYEGDMVLAFGDRTGFLAFYNNDDPSAPPEDASIATRGDLIHACNQGDGSWDVENGRPGSGSTCEIPSTNVIGSPFGGDGDGPIKAADGGAGYQSEWYVQAGQRENESALGSLAIDPITGNLITTSGDPLTFVGSGFSYIDPALGVPQSNQETLLVELAMGKAAALGDIEVGCIAPVIAEVGSIEGIVRHVDGDPVPNAVVILTDADGNEVGRATTNGTGEYVFPSVPAGVGYTLTVDPNSITEADGPDADPNNKVRDTLVNPDPVNVTDGMTTTATIATVDEIAPTATPTPEPGAGSVSGTVTHVDGDVVPGVMVNLLDSSGAIIDTVTTDINGAYTFLNVEPETYTVAVDSTSVTVPDDADGDPNNKDENDITNPPEFVVASETDTAVGNSTIAEVTPTPTNTPIPTSTPTPTPAPELGAVTGNISHVDGDPVPGATVNLVQNGTIIQSTVTDALGNYQFVNVLAGSGYTAEVDPTTVSPADGPDADPLDKDPSGIVPVDVPSVIANEISQAPIIDVPEPSSPEIRVIKTGSIGQANVGDEVTYTYEVVNVGDVPISNLSLSDDKLGSITLDLGEDAAGTLGVLQTATGTATHIVTEADLASGDITNVARATGLAPDGTPVMDEDAWSVTVTEEGVELGSIGDTITNLDTGAPLQGVTVSLTGNGLLRSMETNASGMYLFENLPEGEYTITVDPTTLPDTKEVGDQPTSSTVMLGNGEDNLDQDFAYPTAEILGSIGDRVFNADTNAPLPNITINLLDENGEFLQSTTTNENGIYIFDELPLGTYNVEVDTTTVTTKDPNNVGTAPDGPAVLTADMPDVTDQDFSYGSVDVLLGSIGDMITNADSGAPLPGVVVRLTWPAGADEFPITNFATTDSEGMYLFDGLPAGEYTVDVLVGTLPEGKTAEGVTSTMMVTLGEDEDYLDADFAYPSLEETFGSIGDTIYNDTNGDGTQNTGEPGLAGVVVSLSGPSGPMQATTDADGMYLFSNIPMGDYTIIVDPSSLPDNKQGADNTGDPDGSTPNSSSVMLSEMGVTDDPDQDFGYLLTEPKGSIGRIIFHDLNGNGTQDPGEPGLPGVEVVLTDSADMTTTQTTDASGAYLFSGLELGTYDVTVNQETLPLDKQTISADPDGGADGTSTTTLSIDGQLNDPDEDFGVVGEPPVFGSISRVIWHDINGNGVQDDGEPGLPGVRLTLTDADGNILDIVNTGTNGEYVFVGLELDTTYNVTVDSFSLPAGKQGATNTADPDGGSDSTSTLMLESDGTVNDVLQNFGYQLLGSIGDFVYSVAPTGTIPLEGVMIELRDATGAVLETVETDAAGAYIFTGLPVGAEYTIELDESTLPLEKRGKAPFYVLDSGDDSVVTVTLDSAETLIADFGYGSPTSVSLAETSTATSNVALMLGVIVTILGTAVIMTRRS